MTLADSVEIWPGLLRLARDDHDRTTSGRRQFLARPDRRRADNSESRRPDGEHAVDREIRKQAVFALSQRPQREGVPALIQIARTNRDPEIRKTALFWLGQSSDPRALALFEEILSRAERCNERVRPRCLGQSRTVNRHGHAIAPTAPSSVYRPRSDSRSPVYPSVRAAFAISSPHPTPSGLPQSDPAASAHRQARYR